MNTTHKLCSCLGWPVLIACCLSAVGSAAETAPREPVRKVFAHYMLCFMAESFSAPPNIHTGGGKIEGYLREIDAAHKAGLDGFALEALAWDKELRYIHNADTMFKACEQYNKEQKADFKLFMIVNFCTSMDWDQARRIATRYLDRTCYFHHDGKPMFSCWDGSNPKCGGPTAAGANKGWDENFIKPLAQQGHAFTFMPFVYPDVRREITQPNDAREILAAMPVLNGHWYWGCSGLGDDIARSSGYNVKACRDAGILSAGPVSAPYTAKHKGNNRYFTGMGAQSLADQWLGHIKDQPDFVIFTTWNDLSEHHYVGPHYNVDTYPHGAYLELSAWFIRWYKSSKQPPIERDALFYFYPTQPADLECPKDPLGKPKLVQNAKYKVENCVYATVLLTAPASVEIVSGGKATTQALEAGMHHLAAPLAPGQQTFAIKRDGKTIVEATGGRPIEASAEAYNFQTYSGFAAATYTVTYNANGATSGTAPVSQIKTHDVSLTLATSSGNLTKTDYIFSGWNTAANGSGTNYRAWASYTPNASAVLYAKWTMNQTNGTVVTYPAPTGADLSDQYTVTVNGKPVAVYIAPVRTGVPGYNFGGPYSFAYFDFTGTVRVDIGTTKSLASLRVLPESRGIHPDITGQKASFVLTEPQQLSFEPNVKNGPLLIFANPVEIDPPQPGDPNVIYYGPGIHQPQPPPNYRR